MKRFNRTQRNYIIAGLCMILVIMGVGYAAFSSQLKISGTSNITSNWDIEITGIDTVLPSQMGIGDTPAGYNITEPTYTPASATFSAGFELPGSMIGYIVEISNLGSIDGQVGIANLSCSNNSVIICQAMAYDKNPLQEEPTNDFIFNYGNKDYSDITFSLKVREKNYIFIMVGYDDVTEQPSNLNTNIKLDLTYEQYVDLNRPVPSGETAIIGGQDVELVSGGDGLYIDEYVIGRTVYKGSNPNNYIKFNNELWRIISKESDGTYKIVKNELLSDQVWDTNYSNNWARPSTLNTYLNGEYYRSLDSSIKDYIVSHSWGIGEISYDSNLGDQINDENKTTYNGYIGLITASEYLRANTNTEQCETLSLNSSNYTKCNTTNWLFLNKNYWTISPDSYYSDYAWFVKKDGSLFRTSVTSVDYTYIGSIAPRPVLYLTSDITLIGEGTESNPFTITN